MAVVSGILNITMDIDKIQKMIEDGFVLADIKQRLGLTKAEIEEIRTYGFKLKPVIFSEDKIDEIMDLYRRGVSMEQLKFKYSIHQRRIKKWAKDLGIFRTFDKSLKRVKFDETVFDNIDTSQKAYWLGFLYADGTNGGKRVSLSLKSADIDHIKKFCDFLKISHNNIYTDDFH